MQGCKTSTYFEEFVLGKPDKKEKGQKRTNIIQYDQYYARGKHGVTWVHREGAPKTRESGKLSEAVIPG